MTKLQRLLASAVILMATTAVVVVHGFTTTTTTTTTTATRTTTSPENRPSILSSRTKSAINSNNVNINSNSNNNNNNNNNILKYRNTNSLYAFDDRSNQYYNMNDYGAIPPVQSRTVTLSTWIEAEVLSCLPNTVGSNIGYNSLTFREPTSGYQAGQKAPLIFIHGSFHAAWCWAEYYLPYFASMGYPAIALSLRGTSGSPAGRGAKKVSVDRHADDISSLVDYVTAPTTDGGMGLGQDAGFARPVLIGHSFGGLYIMKFLEKNSAVNCRRLGGVAMLCSVPPSGNTDMTARTLKRSIKDSWDITSGLAMKQCTSNVDLCRKLFFGGRRGIDDMGVSDADIRRYQKNFKRDSVVTLDLNDLQRKLPSARTNNQGMALYAYDLPPCLVVGASDDRIVDVEGVIETATFLGVQNPVFVESAHDVMLGRRWQNCANVLLQWLEGAVW